MEATTGICWAPQLRGEIFDVEANLEDHQQISTAVQAVRAHYASLAEAPGVPLERLAKRAGQHELPLVQGVCEDLAQRLVAEWLSTVRIGAILQAAAEHIFLCCRQQRRVGIPFLWA